MIEILIILVVLIGNGVFAMTEIALVSARKGRLRQLAEEGNSGAQKAFLLLENPERFLSSVQIGITLVGVVSGAFGGAALSARSRKAQTCRRENGDGYYFKTNCRTAFKAAWLTASLKSCRFLG